MAHRFIVDVPGVPKSPSPISNAVIAANTCYISGQLCVYDDGYRPGTATEEAERAFELVFRIADYCGFAKEEITYVDIAFADLSDVGEVNAVYGRLFPVNRPARTIYQAAKLPFGGRVKVQAVAVRT